MRPLRPHLIEDGLPRHVEQFGYILLAIAFFLKLFDEDLLDGYL